MDEHISKPQIYHTFFEIYISWHIGGHKTKLLKKGSTLATTKTVEFFQSEQRKENGGGIR